ncbi:MAG: helix-turn-helix domain-containing protein [Myxococcota bacterium]
MPRRKSQDVAPEYFTTFQVAKMLHVSPPTVVNWVNSGLLTAHRTPGGHRRIAKADIVAFVEGNVYPNPFDKEPTQIPLIPAPPPAVRPPPPPMLKRVLIVDDLPEFCYLVRDYLLEVGGYEVEVAFSGFAAGLTVGRFQPELILLDIDLDPHKVGAMDGFQLLKTLRDDPQTSSIPVIACSGLPDARIEAEVRRGTLFTSLEKPFPLSQLVDVMQEALAGRAQPRSAQPAPTFTTESARTSYAKPKALTASALRV